MNGTADAIHVLHVDDDPDFADLAATFMEREDGRFRIETASDAADGLDRLSESRFDCVISDYDMPGRDGIEFLEAVREDHPDLPFILYTGKGSEAVASEAISAGVTDYLQKETGTSQYAVLANRVENAVEQYHAKREVEASQRRLSLFFEQSPLGVVEWNEDFEFVRLNETAEEILGYSEAEVRGDSWERVVAPADRGEVADVVADLLEGDGGHYSTHRNVTEGGETVVCEWHNRIVTDDDGEIVAILSQFRDVTAEHHRRRRHERQREALFELATDEAVATGAFDAAVRRITETAADVLDVPRINVWLVDDADGDEVLTCVDHYDRSTGDHERGRELVTDEYPAYFEALADHRTIDAADARADPRTAELADDYLDEHDIGALLDATLRSEGDVVGVVCHEHVGGTRDWAEDEIQFAGQVADLIHRALRNEERAEQRRETAFRRSLLEAQQEATLDGVLVVDDDGDIVSYNDRLVDLWGIPERVIESGDDGVLLEWAMDRLADPERFRDRVEYLYENPTETARDEIELTDGRVFDRYSAPVVDDEGTHYGRLWTFRDITDQKEREAELRRTTARLEALFDGSPDMINVHDTDGNIVDPNPRLCEQTGYTPSELTDMSVWDLDRELDPDDAVALWEDMDAGDTRRLDGVYRRRDGSTFPVDVHVRRLRPEEGDRFVAIARDVSERRERERRWKQAEQVFEHTQDALFLIDVRDEDSFRVERVNRAYEELTGLSNDDVENATPRDVLGEEQGAAVEARYRNCVESRSIVEYDEELVIDGELRYWHTRLVPIIEDDAVVRLVGVTREITEREEREQELRRYETILDTIDDVAFVVDDEWTTTYVNETISEYVDVPAEALEGRSVSALADEYVVEEDGPERFESVIERMLSPGTTIDRTERLELTLDLPAGEEVFEYQFSPLVEDGAPSAVAVTMRNVTDRKRRERALREERDRLEEFASVVSHDLRNPLTVAQGRLELVEDECDSEHLAAVERAQDRMDALVDDLLTLAQGNETGTDVEPVALAPVVDECWANVETESASLVVDVDRTVEADRSRLKQLFENLVRNAVEHGGEDVTVTVGELTDGFYVEDDGPGIPADERDGIFDAGYTTSEDGTGFGLSIVEQVVEAHGWEVRVTEESEGGARFEITGVESVE